MIATINGGERDRTCEGGEAPADFVMVRQYTKHCKCDAESARYMRAWEDAGVNSGVTEQPKIEAPEYRMDTRRVVRRKCRPWRLRRKKRKQGVGRKRCH